MYSMEWSLGAKFWSGDWNGVEQFWSGNSTCSLLIKLCILWSGVLEQSFGVEYWSGVDSNFGGQKYLLFSYKIVYSME